MRWIKKIWVICLLMGGGCIFAPIGWAQDIVSVVPLKEKKETQSLLAPPLEPIIGDWFAQSAHEYQDELQRLHTTPLSKADQEKIKARLQESVKKKNLPGAVADQEFLAGTKEARFSEWFELALLLREKARIGKKLDYEQNMRAQKAAYIAYTIGQKAEQKAAALLVLASTYEMTPGYTPPEPFQLYELAGQLAPIPQVRKDFPQTQNLVPFQFEKFVLNNEGDTPGICFDFSGNLSYAPGVKISDYIQMTPQVDSAWQVSGRQVCALNLQFGAAYRATVKKGLPGAAGEKLAQDEVVTFKVTDRAPRLSFVPQTYVLMKNAKGGVPLSSVNVEKVNLKILRINDRSLTPRLNEEGLLNQLYTYDINTIEKVKGEKLWQGSMEVAQVRNQSVVTEIPFSEVIKNPLPGIYLIFAEYTPLFQQNAVVASQWIVVTDVGLSAFSGVEGLQVFARSLATAKPLKGVSVQLIARNNGILSEGTTDGEGKVVFDPGFLRGKGGDAPLALYAYGPGEDFSLLNLKTPPFDLSDRGVSGREMPKAMDVFLYTERGVYRPGETVHVTGLLRNVEAIAVEGFPLTLKLLRPDGVEISTDLVKTNLAGSFVQTYALKGFSQTGRWTLLAYADRKSPPIGSVDFSVEDFVPARLDFSLSLQRPFLEVNQPNEINLNGRYLFGAPASGLKGEAQLVIRENRSPFPAYQNYTFGLEEEEFNNQRHTVNFGPTDNTGKTKIPLLVSIFPDTSHPLEVSLRVSLFEAGGRPRIKDLRFPFLKQAVYLGIKPLFSEKTVEKNEAAFEIIALNEKGHPQSCAVEYALYKEEMQYTWYQDNPYAPWTYKAFAKKTPLLSGTLSTQEKTAVPLRLVVADWGQHRLVLKDSKTGAISSYAFSRGWGDTLSQGSPDKLLVRLDKKNYHIRENVQVYIKAPFAGEGQLLVMNNKILESRKISIPAEGLQVTLTATEKWGTGAYITVIAYNPLNELPQTKTLYPQPKRAIGLAWAAMNLDDHRLSVDIQAPEVIRPRQIVPVTLTVNVVDKYGAKKPADRVYVTLAAVDEGILGLTDFSTPNPLAYFLGKRRLGIEIRDLYGYLIETGFGNLGTLKTGGAALMAQRLSGITRNTLKPLSLFSGLATVDEKGQATIPLSIPDFNGKIRLMAVAFTTNRYGNSEKEMLVQDPVVLEVSSPRFLAPADQAMLTFSLHSTDDKASPSETFKGTLTTTAIGSVAFENKQPIAIDFKDTKAFYGTLALKASNLLGQGNFNLTFKNTTFQAEKSATLTVRSAHFPVTTSILEQIPPQTERKIDFKQKFAGMLLEQSTLYLRATDRLPWNMNFLIKSLVKNSCYSIDHAVTKVFPLLYIKNPQIYPVEFKTLEQIKEAIEEQILYLVGQQSSQGYFSLWGEAPDPWLTAYIVNFWVEASRRGYTVPDFALKRGMGALTQFVQQTQPTPQQLPGIAYALYTLAQGLQVDLAQVRYFYETYTEQMPSALGLAHIGGALALLGDLPRAEKAFEKAFAFANPEKKPEAFAQAYKNEGNRLGSSLRDSAAVIALIFEVREKVPTLSSFHPQILALTQTVSEITQSRLADVKKTSPDNTFSLEEKSWLLIAGQFLHNETETAPLALEINHEPVMQKEWDATILGHTLPQGEGGVTLKNNGNTPVWLMTTMTGIPLAPKPAANGIELTRRFYTLDGKEVPVNKLAQNSQVVVVLSGKVVSDRLHHLMFTDLLPAGFEIENARMRQGDAPQDLSWLKDLSTPARTEIRDDRYVALLRLTPEIRTFKLAYLVRAVTCGTFTYPASFVEDLYSPVFFNRISDGTLTITP